MNSSRYALSILSYLKKGKKTWIGKILMGIFVFGSTTILYQGLYTQKFGPDLYAEVPNISSIACKNKALKSGGYFNPSTKTNPAKNAIIIPFRNRQEHLKVFLHYMHPLLQRKNLEYKIFIVNQVDGGSFNRGKLMNVGFAEAKREGFDCFIFHDVDLVLVDDFCPMMCTHDPVHLGYLVDKFNYRPPVWGETTFMGGSTAMRGEQFERINGMSNSFWGWGGEDDDLYWRVKGAGMNVIRDDRCKYNMIKHGKDPGNESNPDRFKKLLRPKAYSKTDGLVNLSYQVVARREHALFTNITVDIFAQKWTRLKAPVLPPF